MFVTVVFVIAAFWCSIIAFRIISRVECLTIQTNFQAIRPLLKQQASGTVLPAVTMKGPVQ